MTSVPVVRPFTIIEGDGSIVICSWKRKPGLSTAPVWHFLHDGKVATKIATLRVTGTLGADDKVVWTCAVTGVPIDSRDALPDAQLQSCFNSRGAAEQAALRTLEDVVTDFAEDTWRRLRAEHNSYAPKEMGR